MSLLDSDTVCTKADVCCNLGGGQGGGDGGIAQPLKVTFISVSFGKDCSENARGKVGGRRRGGGKWETKKAKDEKCFSYCSQFRSFSDR